MYGYYTKERLKEHLSELIDKHIDDCRLEFIITIDITRNLTPGHSESQTIRIEGDMNI